MILEPFSTTTWRRAAVKRRDPLNFCGKRIHRAAAWRRRRQMCQRDTHLPLPHFSSHPQLPFRSLLGRLLGRQLRAHLCKQGNMLLCKTPSHQSSSSKVQLLGVLLPSEASCFVSVVPTATRCVCLVRVEQQGSGDNTPSYNLPEGVVSP